MVTAYPLLERIRIVLVEPSHPGNIGAVARAMKVMGLSQLCLVSPRRFPSAEATERASSADDILQKAHICTTLVDAVVGCHWIIAASARTRTLDWPTVEPRELAALTTSEFAQGTLAVIFGRENSGLTNQELRLCHRQVVVPTNPDYSSLNLAMAVQLVCYEFRLQALSVAHRADVVSTPVLAYCPAPADDMERFYQHLEQTLVASGFLDPDKPRQLMTRLRRLFSRAAPDAMELNILRGILASVGDSSVAVQPDISGGSDGAAEQNS